MWGGWKSCLPSTEYPGRRGRILLSVSLVLYVLGIGNWIYPVVRTSSPIVNHIFVTLVFFLPVFMVFMVPSIGKRYLRISSYLLLTPVMICSSLLGIMSLSISLPDVAKFGFDPSHAPVSSFQISKSRITVYRTNGGATTSFGVVARHERYILPGIAIVRRIYTAYPGYDAVVTDLGNGQARIVSPPYSERRSYPHELIVNLKPWVYQ